MTTPAINLLEGQTVTGSIVFTDSISHGSEVTVTPKPNCLVHRRSESRPASVNNTQAVNGWRNPSAWNHSARDQTPQPIGANWGQIGVNPQLNGSTRYYDGAGWDQTTGPTYQPDSNDESRAIIKALSKLKNQKVNLAQAFFEREQTVRLFYDTANLITNSIEAFRRKNPKYLWDYIKHVEGSQPRAVPKKWLEVQYGWKPGMQDVQGSCDKLRETYNDSRSFRASVSATIRRNVKNTWRKGVSTSSQFGLIVKDEGFVLTKVRLDYSLENPFLASLASLGITNPASLVWELLPYSFVIDWFTDVGGWLNAMDAALGWNFMGGTKTVFVKVQGKGTGWYGSGYSPTGQYRYTPLGPPSFADNQVNHTRTVYSSSPLPRFPGLKNPMSYGHVANALSLLATAFGR